LTRHTVPLPDYPAVLLQPWRNDHTQAEFEEIVAALCEHYQLEHPATRAVSNEFLAALALKLLRDFVPAFRQPKPPGRPPADHVTEEEYKDYMAAGGNSPLMTEAYLQARFVLHVRKLEKECGSLKAAFTRLAGAMPADVKRRQELPKRYQSLKQPAAFADVWRHIPAFVRTYPDRFIPLPPRD